MSPFRVPATQIKGAVEASENCACTPRPPQFVRAPPVVRATVSRDHAHSIESDQRNSMAAGFSEKSLDSFNRAAASLKLFSRAELNDEKNRSLIEKLYVDPLPNDQVFKTLLGDSTTFIVGRKGTGKSTVFQRVQHEIRKNRLNIISAYMDIRNVYESSQVDSGLADKIDQLSAALPTEQIQKLLLYKSFLKVLISEIRSELKTQVDQNFLSKIKDRVQGTSSEVFSGLDKIIASLDAASFENVGGVIQVQRKTSGKTSEASKLSAATEATVSITGPGAKISGEGEFSEGREDATEETYSRLLMRVVDVNSFMAEIKAILNAIGVKYIYIFLDDFSELPEEPMRLLVDSLISPLARWSDFIKFKIAAYPGRVYYGSLDTTKIEVFALDTYGLYGAAGVTKMEEKSVDFVKRVVTRRIEHYCKSDLGEYFAATSEEFWRALFYASMANPRILGHIMLYAYESNLLYGNKIGLQSIQEASQRYYEEKVATYFSQAMYRLSFHERSSVFSLKELLESIVSRARGLRQEDRLRDGRGPRGRVYSSHFYITQDFEDLLTSLELAFFITKYFEQSDRGAKRVSVYALNYGLCQKYQIGFGRPSERREDRLYFVERPFDYNAVLRAYVKQNQEIKCDKCGAEFDLETMPAIKMLKMRCPTCGSGTCQVVNLSKKYDDMLKAVNPELLLPETELGILQTLHNERRTMFASEIAGELDCSGQLVGRRARHLSERTLVERASQGQLYSYTITDEAEAAYFDQNAEAALDLALDDGDA